MNRVNIEACGIVVDLSNCRTIRIVHIFRLALGELHGIA